MQVFFWCFVVPCGAVLVLGAAATWVTRPERPLESLGPVRRFVRLAFFPGIDATPEERERMERAREARQRAAECEYIAAVIRNTPGRWR